MIIHNIRPTSVRVVNSWLPVYRTTYGDGLGDVIQGLFRRVASKALPIAKQLLMKSIDVVKDKAPGAIHNLAGKAFMTINDRLSQLIHNRNAIKPLPVKLPSTEIMPVDVSKVINQAANKKLASLVNQQPEQINMSLIPGSGLRFRRR